MSSQPFLLQFISFSDRIAAINASVVSAQQSYQPLNVDEASGSGLTSTTHFANALEKWSELDASDAFGAFCNQIS